MRESHTSACSFVFKSLFHTSSNSFLKQNFSFLIVIKKRNGATCTKIRGLLALAIE